MKKANPYLILVALLLALAAWLLFTGRLDGLYLRLVEGEDPAPGEEPEGPGEEPAADRLDCDLYLRNGVYDSDEVAILQRHLNTQIRAPLRAIAVDGDFGPATEEAFINVYPSLSSTPGASLNQLGLCRGENIWDIFNPMRP